MSIAPITPPSGFGIAPSFGINPAYGAAAQLPSTQVEQTQGAQGVQSFGQLLAEKIGEVNGLQQRSDALAVKASTGDLKDIHEYTIAAQEANVATQLAVAVRNKGLEAFNEIMRMQL